jgi:hypothetical protein
MQKRVELDGLSFTIDQLPAKEALHCALVRGKWQGEILREVGDADGAGAAGAATAAFCRMLLAPEYHDACFMPLLRTCRHSDGRPVVDSWQVEFIGDRLGTLVKLHNEAMQHSCGAFLAGLAGGLTAMFAPPQTTGA